MVRYKTFFLVLFVLFGKFSFSQLNFTLTSSAGAYSLTCKDPSITLSTSTNFTSPVNYTWTTPQLNVLVAPSILISTPGTFTVNASSGSVTATKTIAIDTDTITPTVTLTASESSLTCVVSSVTLTAISNPSTVSYSW